MDLGGQVKGYCSQEDFDSHSFTRLNGFVGHTVYVVVEEEFKDEEIGTFFKVSRKKANEMLGAELLSRLQEGDIINGTISGYNEEKNTIFINLGGVDGFCYLEDWDYVRIPSVRDAGVIGEPVSLVVKKITRDPLIIRLSRKEASRDPWIGVEKEFPVNSIVLGKVTNVDPKLGIFVSIKRGVTIMGHLPSRSSLPKPIPGQPVQGEIVSISEEKRRGRMIIRHYPHGAIQRANPGAYLFE
jgi:small subunit ribosomal protein S1